MSGQFQLYKKTGALQASLMRYQQPVGGKKHRSGAVYLEVSKCIDYENKVYDWANTKIGMALFTNDIQTILNDIQTKPGQDIKLYHQKNGTVKKCTLRPGKGGYAGTWMLSFMMKTGDGKETQVTVPFSAGEWAVFIALIKSSLPAIFGWDVSGVYEVDKRNEDWRKSLYQIVNTCLTGLRDIRSLVAPKNEASTES